MPIYCYECHECGHEEEVLRSMADSDKPHECKWCGSATKRDYRSEHPNALGTEKGDTFWSQSLAINPEQTAEHRRLFPDVRVREDGCVGFDSVAIRDKYLEKTGFVKEPGKLRGPSKKIQLTPATTQAT